jgi:hypothetical protein
MTTDRQIAFNRDAHRLQVVCWPDARAHQDRRAIDGTCAKNDLTSPNLGRGLAIDVNPNANCLAIFDDDTVDQRLAANLEIGASAPVVLLESVDVIFARDSVARIADHHFAPSRGDCE